MNVQVVDADNLSPITAGLPPTTPPVLLAIAAHFEARDSGTVRLIDNIVIE
jgi:pantothenate synthetase